MQGFPACWHSCSDAPQSSFSFCTMVLALDSFILKWWATEASDLNLRYLSSISTSSCMSWPFCFLGTLSASLLALHMGPMVLFKVYGIALKRIKNTRERQEITFYCSMQFIGETTLSRRLALCDILNGYLQYLSSL